MSRPRAGVDLDAEGRCAHWRGPTDVVAIRFACCAPFWGCHACHDELADHRPVRWTRSERHRAVVLCGVCDHTLSIRTYLSVDGCPSCGHPFNPRCATHHPLYFEVEPA